MTNYGLSGCLLCTTRMLSWMLAPFANVCITNSLLAQGFSIMHTVCVTMFGELLTIANRYKFQQGPQGYGPEAPIFLPKNFGNRNFKKFWKIGFRNLWAIGKLQIFKFKSLWNNFYPIFNSHRNSQLIFIK